MERGLEDFYKDGTVPYRKKVRRKVSYVTKAIQAELFAPGCSSGPSGGEWECVSREGRDFHSPSAAHQPTSLL